MKAASRAAAPAGIARFDSATALARALSLSLHGRTVDSLSESPALDRMMPLVNRLPVRAAEWIYSAGGMTEAIGKSRVSAVDVERIAAWIAGLFPDRSYPSAFIGSSNGALMHLAAAMGVPWLPQTFLCPVRQFGVSPDDPEAALRAGRPIVETLLTRHPELSIHHMHDPNQDRLMLKLMSYYRLKHRRLPRPYRSFLAAALPRGATLFVCACSLSWPITRTGERSVFQFGALGGATLDDYFRGGERTRAYLARYKSKRTQWTPPAPTGSAPEAEWGFEPALMPDLMDVARAMGWRVVELRFEHPEAMSFLAAAVYRDWYRAHGIEPTRVLVDSFILLDPLRTLRLHAVPFWSFFSVEPSAGNLERFLGGEPPTAELDLMVFSHGTHGIGLAAIEDWRRLARRARRWRFVGVDERLYPRDFATFIRFAQDLADLGPVGDIPPALESREFESLARRHGPRFGITVTER
jgi:hypothetical protein